MARRRRDREIDGVEIAVQLGLLFLGMVVLASGILGLGKLFSSVISIIVTLLFLAAGFLALFFAGRTLYRKSAEARSRPPFRPAGWTPPVFPNANALSTGTPFPMFFAEVPPSAVMRTWTATTILAALEQIDWYQFERFCAALLRSDGYDVVRKGGAHADGGVDLIAEKGDERILVQCKHWRTREVKENILHGLLGGMTQFQVNRAALYTLHGWTKAAGRFAAKHSILLVDGETLAARAAAQLTAKQLHEVLNPELHHCPKCEAPMVWRESGFRSLWGCSNYPRCTGTLKHSGAH